MSCIDKKREIKFSPPDISDVEIEEVVSVLKSGWITTGPKVKILEKEIAKRVGTDVSESGTPRAVCLNSQTACSEMTLRLLGVKEGNEVITSSYTYTATASVICHVGAKPVLIDTVKDGLEMDYVALEKAINKNTKVIIPVDIGGVPCDYDRIFEIVNAKKDLFVPENEIQEKIGRVIVLADTAHAFGAERKGIKVGNIADFSSFSFHAVKNLTTGEGGTLTWKRIEGISDDEIYRRFQLLSLHGQSKDALAKTKLGSWEYDIVGAFYKCNMTDFTAGIGLGQLSRYDKMLERRKSIIEKYDAAFKPYGVKSLAHYTKEYSSSGHLYITRVFKKDGSPISDKERREIIVKMAERGIACNVHYKPLPMHTAYKNMGFDIKNYPNAYANFMNEITLPLHTLLTDDDVNYIIENYVEILKDYR